MRTRLLIDTSIPIHAEDAEGPLRAPCAALMGALADGRLDAEASVELVQEYVHVNLRRGFDRDRVRRQGERLARMLRLHPFDPDHLPSILGMLGSHPQLGVRDAVHAVAGLANGVEVIVSPDRDFDGIEGLERIDPREEGALDRLLTQP